MFLKKIIAIKFIILFLPFFISADNYYNNSYNNHGVIGLINMPTARFFDESVHGITYYDGDPDQKITLTSSPFDWMEASFFYMNVEEFQLCRGNSLNQRFCQGYKDKGFNLKLRIKKEGKLPAIAIGLNDFAGTGIYSSEYIVSSFGIDNIDIHAGIGWGKLSNDQLNFKNPAIYIANSFKNRPELMESEGGSFQPSRYFSGNKVSPFLGISYAINDKTLAKFEYDSTSDDLLDGLFSYEKRKNDFSFGIEYLVNDNFSIGLAFERGNFLSFKFGYKNNPLKKTNKSKYKKYKSEDGDNKYTKLINNIENNGIGVNKIIETSSAIGLELTQFMHPNIKIIEEIILAASKDAGINKVVKKDIKIANLKAVTELDQKFLEGAEIIYQRESKSQFNTSNTIKFRPFLASREAFFKGSLLLENNSEYVIKDNLIFSSNLKYSLYDNFDDLTIPPADVYPAQVRSDIKEYLRNIDEGVLIGRAQIDYYLTPKQNHHLMATFGILEDMFSGYGFEYLYHQQNTNYAYGFELFEVRKRDYHWGLNTLDYQNITGSFNLYYRNYGSIPFDMKFSIGEYLAGDFGTTYELSRTFNNGTKFGIFASFTDVTPEQYGEGSFDKGLFFHIPIYGNFINYTWRPLTKDPGAKLSRKNNLYDLLVRFEPIN
jgi:hypothetical protein